MASVMMSIEEPSSIADSASPGSGAHSGPRLENLPFPAV